MNEMHQMWMEVETQSSTESSTTTTTTEREWTPLDTAMEVKEWETESTTPSTDESWIFGEQAWMDDGAWETDPNEMDPEQGEQDPNEGEENWTPISDEAEAEEEEEPLSFSGPTSFSPHSFWPPQTAGGRRRSGAAAPPPCPLSLLLPGRSFSQETNHSETSEATNTQAEDIPTNMTNQQRRTAPASTSTTNKWEVDPCDPLGIRAEERLAETVTGPAKYKFNTRIRAPDIDPDAAAHAALNSHLFRETREQRNRRLRFQRLHRNMTRLYEDKHDDWISYLHSKYEAKTSVNMATTLQGFFPELKSSSAWNIALMHLKQRSAETPSRGKKVANFEEVAKVIGNLDLPAERAAFQIWAVAARQRETLSILNDEGTAMRGRVWRYNFFEPNIVGLHLHAHKGATTGKRPYTKWIRLAPGHLERGIWARQQTTYREVLRHIKARLGHQYTTYSVRKGAIQFIESFFQPEQVAKLTGHQTINRVPSVACHYTARQPHHGDAQEVLEMTDLLQAAVLQPAWLKAKLPPEKLRQVYQTSTSKPLSGASSKLRARLGR